MTTPKPFVFGLMPFADEFDDVYKLGIKPACDEAGAYAERADEQIFEGSILEQVYNQISKADIIVADMTGRNPNVFYETGYAHALGKKVILLTQKEKDIPFDLLHYTHIIYENKIADKLKPELAKRVRFFIENPDLDADSLTNQLDFYIDGIRLKELPSILPHKMEQSNEGNVRTLSLHFDIHNSVDKYIRNAEFRLGVVASNIFKFFSLGSGSPQQFKQGRITQLPKGNQILHMFPDEFALLPDAWENLILRAAFSKQAPLDNSIYEIAIRIFTDKGKIDLPIIFQLKQRD